jgi:integrase
MRPRKHNRNLPPCVYHRHGAYYLVKAGKWTRLAAELPAALKEYARLLDQPKGGMAEMIHTYLPDITHNKAESTIAQYATASRKLQTIFAEFAPHQVLPKHVAQMRRALKDTPNMANRCITVLRLVFDCAVEDQIVDSNPCTGIRRLEEASRDRLIEHGEFVKIRHHAAPRLQLMMDIAYLTGQRIMDVARIHRADIKSDGLYFKQAKTDAKLQVRWTPELVDKVEQAKQLGGKINALSLFHSKRGMPPSYRTIYDQWRRACKLAGITDTTLRDIRAMSATNAEDQGKNPTSLLGHTNPQMTRRYLRGKKTPVVDGPSFGQSN